MMDSISGGLVLGLGIALLFLFLSVNATFGLFDGLNRIGDSLMSRFPSRRRRSSSDLGDRLFVWFLFVIFASLTPVGLIWLLRAHNHLPSKIVDILATGDATVVAVVLIIGSLGDLILSLFKRKANKADALAICILVGAIVYGVAVYILNASLCSRDEINEKPGMITFSSLGMIIFAAIIGAGIIWKSSRDEQK